MSARDSVASSYDERYAHAQPNRTNLHRGRWPRNRREASVFFAPGGERVLDVGCGSGVILYNLRERYRELHGIELSEERVRVSEGTLEGLDAHVQVGDIETGLDYPDAHFDTIVIADVIEHVVNVWTATAEMTRILKPGGQIVLSTPNIAELRNRLTLLRGRFPSTSADDEGFATKTPNEMLDGGHLHYFTFSMLRKLFARYGYSRVEEHGIGNLGKLHDLWPALLSGSCMVVAVK